LSLAHHDVYVSAVGGVRISEPGADLAVCMALASAQTGKPVGDDVVVLGEVGLGGEVRQVAHTPRRLAEAARLGFARALVPDRGPDEGPLALRRVPTLAHALDTYLGGDRSALPPLRVVGADPAAGGADPPAAGGAYPPAAGGAYPPAAEHAVARAAPHPAAHPAAGDRGTLPSGR
jgi:hypothetical protein